MPRSAVLASPSPTMTQSGRPWTATLGRMCGPRLVRRGSLPWTRSGTTASGRSQRPPSPLLTSMFKALGAGPTTINFSEVYSSLQTKVADGQENPLALVSANKFYEVQKYCSLTNHMWDGFWFLANRRAWEKLPTNLKEIVSKNINEAGLAERADVAKLNDIVLDEFVAH